MEFQQVKTNISDIKRFWANRNKKFKEWFEFLVLIDQLSAKGMESYASNEPQTFYNMAHYLLTKGEINHSTPIESETALELDRKARIHRGCQSMWKTINRTRQLGGRSSFIDELGFFLLVLGWYSTILAFDEQTGSFQTQIWSPYDTYPTYANGKLASCVHSYKVTTAEAKAKAEANNWNYTPRASVTGDVILEDYFYLDGDVFKNIILIDDKDVTGWVDRPEIQLLVAPVGGFPDMGSLTPSRRDYKRLMGRGIFEVNEGVADSFNKWKSMMFQIMRDTAQPITQEFSSTPQATPEQLRERGALFHYAPGEIGLQRVPPAGMPIEMQASLLELRREMQKGSFNDAVYGMVEGQPGYALSLLSTSSANQILYPYMDAKHFVLSEGDRFWLSKLKESGKSFEIRGKFIEKIEPSDIPEDITIEVESEVATPKDWLERGTIAGMLDKHLDESTMLTEVLHFNDPQAIKRRKSLDRTMNHPMTQQVEMIAGYQVHADYLERRGDMRQATLFRNAAKSLEAQMGVPPPGSAAPAQASEVEAAVEAGTPAERTEVSPGVLPPEARGFTPQQLRRSLGRGKLQVSRR